MDTPKVVKDADGYKQELDNQDMMKNAGLEWKTTYEKRSTQGFKEPKTQKVPIYMNKQNCTKR